MCVDVILMVVIGWYTWGLLCLIMFTLFYQMELIEGLIITVWFRGRNQSDIDKNRINQNRQPK